MSPQTPTLQQHTRWTQAQLFLGNDPSACFPTELVLISPRYCQTHISATVPTTEHTALPPRTTMPGPESSANPILTESLLMSVRRVNSSRFLIEKSRLGQIGRPPSALTDPHLRVPLGLLTVPSSATIILLSFPMSIFHNRKQKPYNAQLPTLHCVLTALSTAQSTTQEQLERDSRSSFQ